MTDTTRPLPATPTRPPLSTGDRIYFVAGFSWIALLLAGTAAIFMRAAGPGWWYLPNLINLAEVLLIFFGLPAAIWWFLNQLCAGQRPPIEPAMHLNWDGSIRAMRRFHRQREKREAREAQERARQAPPPW